MATVALVKAEDFEGNDLIDASGYLDYEGTYVVVDGLPADVDKWNVRVYTNVGDFVVERSELFPYGGVHNPETVTA